MPPRGLRKSDTQKDDQSWKTRELNILLSENYFNKAGGKTGTRFTFFQYNHLASLFAYLNLQYLDLSNNKLPAIPPQIGRCVELQYLSLKNNLIRELPPEIGKCVNLQQLSLSSNQLTHLPEEIGMLKNLTELYVNNNNLVEIPSTIGKCLKLRHLDVNNNCLLLFPQEIANCTNLRNLLFLYNPLCALSMESPKTFAPPGRLMDLCSAIVVKLSDDYDQEDLPGDLKEYLKDKGVKCSRCGDFYYGPAAMEQVVFVDIIPLGPKLPVKKGYCVRCARMSTWSAMEQRKERQQGGFCNYDMLCSNSGSSSSSNESIGSGNSNINININNANSSSNHSGSGGSGNGGHQHLSSSGGRFSAISSFSSEAGPLRGSLVFDDTFPIDEEEERIEEELVDDEEEEFSSLVMYR
jgi:hypothetical protein